MVGLSPGYTATERAETLLRKIAADKLGSAERWRDVERDPDLPFGRMGTAEEVADGTRVVGSLDGGVAMLWLMPSAEASGWRSDPYPPR